MTNTAVVGILIIVLPVLIVYLVWLGWAYTLVKNRLTLANRRADRILAQVQRMEKELNLIDPTVWKLKVSGEKQESKICEAQQQIETLSSKVEDIESGNKQSKPYLEALIHRIDEVEKVDMRVRELEMWAKEVKNVAAKIKEKRDENMKRIQGRHAR